MVTFTKTKAEGKRVMQKTITKLTEQFHGIEKYDVPTVFRRRFYTNRLDNRLRLASYCKKLLARLNAEYSYTLPEPSVMPAFLKKKAM